jgi:hypothetical protein
MQHVENPSIYFCNIHMKQMQHTSATYGTIEIYNCNIGRKREPDAGSAMAVGSAGIGVPGGGGRRCRGATGWRRMPRWGEEDGVGEGAAAG